MMTQEVAAEWGARAAYIRRWCRMALLPATKTHGAWSIEPHARRPWNDGHMMLRLFPDGMRDSTCE